MLPSLAGFRFDNRTLGNAIAAEPEPISRLGGLAMVAASTVGLILLAALRPKLEWAPALITIGLLFALGFWDDLHPLGAKAKLTGQFLIAGSAYGMGLRV